VVKRKGAPQGGGKFASGRGKEPSRLEHRNNKGEDRRNKKGKETQWHLCTEPKKGKGEGGGVESRLRVLNTGKEDLFFCRREKRNKGVIKKNKRGLKRGNRTAETRGTF